MNKNEEIISQENEMNAELARRKGFDDYNSARVAESAKKAIEMLKPPKGFETDYMDGWVTAAQQAIDEAE